MFLFIMGALTAALAIQGAFTPTNLAGRRRRHRADLPGRVAGPEGPPCGLGRDVPPDLPDRHVRRRPANGARLAVESSRHAPAHPQSHDLRHPRAAAALHRSASATCCRSSTPTSRARPPSTAISAIDHELIRFDDVVAEYPGFEACTPAHIDKVLEFGERVHAQPDSHVLVHCHAGISRSTAAAAILMCQHAPGQEEAAFLKLLGMRKHGWPNTRMVEFADTLLEARRRPAARPAGLPPRAAAGEAAPERRHPQHRPRPRTAGLTHLALRGPREGEVSPSSTEGHERV